MKTSVLSIDLAKSIFQLCALNQAHKITTNVKIKRSELLHQLRQYEPKHNNGLSPNESEQ